MNFKIKLSIILLLLSLIITKSYASDNCRTDIKNSSYTNLSSSTYTSALDLWEKLHKNFINKSNSIQSNTLWKYVSVLSNYKTKYKLEWTKLDIINLLIEQFQCKETYYLKLDGKESSSVSVRSNSTTTVQNQNVCSTPTVRNWKVSSYPDCNLTCNYWYTKQNWQCLWKSCIVYGESKHRYIKDWVYSAFFAWNSCSLYAQRAKCSNWYFEWFKNVKVYDWKVLCDRWITNWPTRAMQKSWYWCSNCLGLMYSVYPSPDAKITNLISCTWNAEWKNCKYKLNRNDSWIGGSSTRPVCGWNSRSLYWECESVNNYLLK